VRVNVLLFAQAADAAGRRALALDLPDGATVADALDRLLRDHPALAPLRRTLAVAVDETYRPHSAALADGNTIAIIPPVSGG
jgi:molybdopterin converting factor subunit 1